MSYFLSLILPLFLGIFVNFVLTMSGQGWAKNISFRLSCALLPLVSSIISTVISGNIALSLGMVGALSIVRFRHPVKTSFELTIFFLLVTVGIASSVNPKYAISVTFLSMLSVYLYCLVSSLRKGKNNFIPNLDIKEYTDKFLVEIVSNSSIPQLASEPRLMFVLNDPKNNIYTYKIATDSISDANELIASKNIDQNLTKITRI